MNRTFVVLLLPWFALPSLPAQGRRLVGRAFATRSVVLARKGMAATSQPLATQAALEILRRGGTAADAAIAADAVLGLVEPTGAGIGGDLFALVWDAGEKRLHGLNASGRSPASLTLEYLKKVRKLRRMPALGPLPVTVPGCVDGWFELHRRFGRLPMKEILAPAIEYARQGFPVTRIIAHYWRSNCRVLRRFPGFAETFMPGGRPPREGEVFKNPRLAATLEKIAAGGRDAFYRGEIAKKIEAYMKANGGFLSAADLAAHRSEWVDPVSTTYRGYRVWELPPNCQGIAVLQMLNILEGFDLASMGFGSPRYVHLLVEAKKLVYEDRARYYADPEFAKIPLAGLLSKSYAAKRRKLIDPERASVRAEAGNPALEKGDTVYLAAADGEGNMVSLIQSNYMGMGSGLTPGGLGFVLQDRGALFDLHEGRPNTYAPRKRPFHTIIPGFLTKDGEALMAFGVMGGAMQPQGQVQVLVNLIDFGMDLQEAGDAPRVRHVGSSQPSGERARGGGTVLLEPGFPEGLKKALEKMGHQVRIRRGGFGGYQAILRRVNTRVYLGASESRKDGQAAGF